MSAEFDSLLLDYCDDIILLVDPADFSIRASNTGAQRHLGYSEDELRRRQITDLECALADVFFWEDVRQGAEPTLQDVRTTYLKSDGSLLDTRKCVSRVPGNPGWLIIRALPIDQLQQVENQLADITSRLQATLEATADGILLVDRGGRIVKMNHRFSRLWHIPEDLLLAHDSAAILDFMANATADPATYRQHTEAIRADGEGESADLVFLANGQVLERCSRPARQGQLIIGRVFSYTDVTQRHRTERREKARNRTLELQARNAPLSEVLDSIIRELEDEDPGYLGSILLLDASGQHLRLGAAPHLPEDYNRAIDGVSIGPAVGSCGTAAYLGERVVVDDIASHPYWFDYRSAALAAGLASCWSEPIKTADGRVLGTFALYRRETGHPSSHDIERIEHAAHQACSVIERYRFQEALAASEERWSFALEGSGDGVWDWDVESGQMVFSQRLESMLGFAEGELGGRADQLHTRIHPEDLASVEHALHDCLQGLAVSYATEHRVRCRDGSWRWVLDRGMVVHRDIHGQAQRMIGTYADINERKLNEYRERARSNVLDQLSRNVPLPDILAGIAAGVPHHTGNLRCALLLLNENGEHLSYYPAQEGAELSHATLSGTPIGAPTTACHQASLQPGLAHVERISGNPVCAHCPARPEGWEDAGCCCSPILGSDGEILGVGAFFRPFLPEGEVSANLMLANVDLMMACVQLSALAIERRRTDNALQIAASVHQALGEAIAVTDESNRIIAINPAFTRLTGYSADEALGQDPKFLSSGRQTKAFYQQMWEALGTSGHWQGEIWNRRKNGEEYPEWLSINTIYNPDGTISRRVAMFSDITDQKRAEETIWRQANFDSLTGLPNRRMFRDRLEQEIKKANRTEQPLALMFIDLDRFKEVNDTLGHDMGDILLKEATRRLCACVRESDTVARLGGDEFTVILSELQDPSSVERVVSSILESLAEPFQLLEEVAYISASVGVTFFPSDASGLEALLKNADQAMYAAKAQGRNCCSFFTPAMQHAAQARMRLASDLRIALGDNQLRLYYQPIVELASGRIHKAEALVRWQHPLRGLIPPGDFISVAEDTGLINGLGDWVFHQAVQQAGAWQGRCQISVNVSPAQFRGDGIDCKAWFAHLKEVQLPPESIVIEITEGLLLDGGTQVTDLLHKFRKARIPVSLDDFGTGYSSLSYLKKFHIDYLKIDQSFVRNLSPGSSDLALCEAIIVMAHKLGLKVVAEGVETESQKNWLAAAGCDYAQGYLFSRPVPAEEFASLLGGLD